MSNDSLKTAIANILGRTPSVIKVDDDGGRRFIISEFYGPLTSQQIDDIEMLTCGRQNRMEWWLGHQARDDAMELVIRFYYIPDLQF